MKLYLKLVHFSISLHPEVKMKSVKIEDNIEVRISGFSSVSFNRLHVVPITEYTHQLMLDLESEIVLCVRNQGNQSSKTGLYYFM